MAGPPGDVHGPPPPPGDAPTTVGEPSPPDEAQPRCHRCGAPHDPFQEYCLECGARLTPRARGSVWRRDTWTRDSPFWFWAAFLGLLAIALVTGAIVLAATDDDDEPTAQDGPTTMTLPTGATTEPLPTTVNPPTFTGTTSETFPTTGTTTGFTTTGLTPTFTTTIGTTTGTTRTTTTTPPGSTATWPAGQSGYTVIVGSFRETRGRGPAETRATQARNAGLTQVGIIRSSEFSSLRPGWHAVFTGIFDTRAEAMTRLSQARSTYPGAYLRHVRP